MKTNQTIISSILAIGSLIYPSVVLASDEPFLGELQYTGVSYCPPGWALANGQLLDLSQNQQLFSLLGTSFGGDGTRNFKLPDFRGRVSIGADSQNKFGSHGGTETIQLKDENILSHTHTATTLTMIKASSKGGTISSPNMAVLADDGSDKIYTSGMPNTTMATGALSSVTSVHPAANQPIDNLQPYQAITVCIAIQGLYPTLP